MTVREGMEFGFSYVGVIYLLMLIVPNIVWSRHQPEGYQAYVEREDRRLLFMERAGEILVSCTVLVFSDFNLRTDSLWYIWIILSFAFMVMYELYWIGYFRSGRTMEDMYSSFLGIPVAGATLPVIAFALLAVYGCNPILGASVAILAVGHIGIHWNHLKDIRRPEVEV